MRKKILITILIVLILMLIAVIIIGINSRSKNNDTDNENNNINIDENIDNNSNTDEFKYTDLISEERAQELFDNSYKYYLLYEGREESYEGNGHFTSDDITYYGISFINTLDEIDEMINNTFTEKRRNDFYDQIFEKRHFIELQEKLYVDYKDFCESIEINFEDLSVTKSEENKIHLDFKSIGAYAHYENDNWYLDSPLHFCIE